MTDDARSGSRWEPEHGGDEAAATPFAQPATSDPAWSAPAAVPPPPAPRKNRPLAVLTAAGLVLVGGAGGWAIGTAVAGGDNQSVQETSVDEPTGDPGVVPAPPGGGQLPDSDGDDRPDFGGRGGVPDHDGDDGPADDGDPA